MAFSNVGHHEETLQGIVSIYMDREQNGWLNAVGPQEILISAIRLKFNDGSYLRAAEVRYDDAAAGWLFSLPTMLSPVGVEAFVRGPLQSQTIVAEADRLSVLPDPGRLRAALANPEGGPCIFEHDSAIEKRWNANWCRGHDAVYLTCNGIDGEPGYAEVHGACGYADSLGGYSTVTFPEGNAAGAMWEDIDVVPSRTNGGQSPIPSSARVQFYIDDLRVDRGWFSLDWAIYSQLSGYHFERREVWACHSSILGPNVCNLHDNFIASSNYETGNHMLCAKTYVLGVSLELPGEPAICPTFGVFPQGSTWTFSSTAGRLGVGAVGTWETRLYRV